MNYTHFVITPYNIGILDESYLSERLHLFERYTASSIKHQTNQNFLWLIFVDNRTDIEYIDSLKSIVDNKSNVLFIKVDVGRHKLDGLSTLMTMYGILYQQFQQLLKHISTKILITTYLDNDDSISIGYVEEIQRFVNAGYAAETRYVLDHKECWWIDVRQCDIYYRGNITDLAGKGNPHGRASMSATVVETEPPYHTACHLHTRLLKSIPKTYFIDSKNLHIVHATNTSLKYFKPNFPVPITQERWKARLSDYFPFLEEYLCAYHNNKL